MNKPKIKIARDAEELGEYESEQIRVFLASGSLLTSDIFWNETANEWQPLSQLRFSKLHGWLYSFDSGQNQALLLWLAIALLIASWLYPPWVHYNPHVKGSSATHPHGWFFIFDTQQGERRDNELVMHVDFGRLGLVDAIIVVVIGATVWMSSRWNIRPAIAVASLVGGGLIFAIVGIGWSLVHAGIEQAKLETEAKMAREAHDRTAQRERERQLEEAKELRARQEAEVKAWASARVAKDDLTKIEIFDCELKWAFGGKANPQFVVYDLTGRIKNGLGKRIGRIVLRVSLFERTHVLLEVQNLIVRKSFDPQEPQSFRESLQSAKEIEPSAISLQIEVTEAYFVN